MTRYVIIGAGAVGSALAAEFRRSGVDHVVVARGEQYRALVERPLRYLRPHRTEEVWPIVVGDPGEVELRTGDVLVLAVKAQQSQAALAPWAWAPVDGGASVAAESIPVVTLQNGLDTERAALRLFHIVLGASLWTPAVYADAGTVAVHSSGSAGLIWIGRYPVGSDELTRRIAADLTAADFPTQVVDDIDRWKAAKLLANVGNAIDVFAADDHERRTVDEALRAETRAVFAAAGVSVADYATESTLDTAGFTGTAIPGADPHRRSTWQSLHRDAGSVETDYLNGEIVLVGRQFGVPTPVNAALQRAVGRLAHQHTGPGIVALRDVVTVDALASVP